MAGEGLSAKEIARRVGRSLASAKKWRSRYERGGREGLGDARARGARWCTAPRCGPSLPRWPAPLAEQVGMSESQAHDILRRADIKPHLLDQWVMSELGADFDAQAVEVCGLYLDPPVGAIVLSLDEKTGIQAKGPTRPDRPAAPGRRAGSTSTGEAARRTCLPRSRSTPARSPPSRERPATATT